MGGAEGAVYEPGRRPIGLIYENAKLGVLQLHDQRHTLVNQAGMLGKYLPVVAITISLAVGLDWRRQSVVRYHGSNVRRCLANLDAGRRHVAAFAGAEFP